MSGNGVSVTMRVVDFDAVFAPTLRRFFTRVMLAGHKAAAERAPVDKGILRGGLAPGAGATQVDTANPPKWAAVGTPVKTYPGVLNESTNTHYRAGPNAGRETKGWLSDVPAKIKPDIVNALGDMAGELKAGWKRG